MDDNATNSNQVLEEKVNEQIKATERLEIELKKVNELLTNAEKSKTDKEKQEQQKEQERIEKGELTTDEKILQSLDNLTKAIQEQPQGLDSEILNELKSLNEKYNSKDNSAISEEDFSLIKTTVQKEYEQFKMSSTVINTYGLVFIPVCLILVFLHGLLKQFL